MFYISQLIQLLFTTFQATVNVHITTVGDIMIHVEIYIWDKPTIIKKGWELHWSNLYKYSITIAVLL